MNEINKYFQNVWSNKDQSTFIKNLIGNCWVTENEIDTLFEILNRKSDDTACIVYKPDKDTNKNLKASINRLLCSEQKHRILLALNVGRDINGTFVTDTSRMGNHWTLLALDIQNQTGFYGDSLGWQIPINLMDSVKHIFCGIDKYVILPINSTRTHGVQHFYPVQSCSHMCGVIVMCMSVIMCEAWDDWYTWNENKAPAILHNPSEYSRHLRLKVISWLVKDSVDQRVR